MKSKNEQENRLLKELFQKSEMRPSIDITEQVMQRIDSSTSVFEYRPIIGKRIWVGLAGAFVLLITFLLFQTDSIAYQTPVLFENLNAFFSKLNASFDFKFNFPDLPKIPFTLMIAIAAINIIGVYLIISYRWSRGMFK